MGITRNGEPATRKLGGQGGGGNNQPTRCGAAKASDHGRAHLDPVFRHVRQCLIDEVTESVPELLAYMISIMRASREFSGLAWAQYDAAYRRQMIALSPLRRKWRRHWRQCWPHAAPELVVAAPRLALALARVRRFAGS